MYVDSAYIAKFYLNEPDSPQVRNVIATASNLQSSAWAVPKITYTFHRKVREGKLDVTQYRELLQAFREHIEAGLWTFAPVTDRLLRKVIALMATLPPSIYVRSGDAAHLATAADLQETEIWSNDRHLLAAAPYFGLIGRSV
jgi:predicted nucleic acid-binding protein